VARRVGALITLAAIYLDQPLDVIAALGAFDVEHVELAVDVAEDEIGPGQTPSR